MLDNHLASTRYLFIYLRCIECLVYAGYYPRWQEYTSDQIRSLPSWKSTCQQTIHTQLNKDSCEEEKDGKLLEQGGGEWTLETGLVELSLEGWGGASQAESLEGRTEFQ